MFSWPTSGFSLDPDPDADIALGCGEDVGNPGRDRGCADVDFLMEGDWYAEGTGLVPLCSCG